MDNYEDREGVQIRAISFDGSPLGAWVNADVGGEWQWVYIAAGDEVNRQMISQAATQGKQ